MARQSDLLSELQRQLRALDDAALSALASAGLLRRARKDLENITPTFDVKEDVAQVHIGAHQVNLDRRGPAQASCTCKAKTTCQHVISACLYLASVAVGEQSTEDDKAASDTPEGALHAELMAYDVRALIEFAGKAVVREALRVIEASEPPEITVAAAICIRLSYPPMELRYAGGGLAAFVTDYRGRHRKRMIVAAVLAYQMSHGASLPTPPGASPIAAKEAHVTTEEVTELRQTLLPKVLRLVLECIEVGIAHVSDSFIERFASLATVAEGAKLHRLSLALNRLADLVELQLERNAQADASLLLDEAARTFALVVALASPHAPPRDELIGEARTTYTETTSLELYCVGAHPWRTSSGYIGITVLFWCPAESRWLSFSESRPVGTAGFSPSLRYRAAGPWKGSDSPAALVGRWLRLTRPALNRSGRLSASADTVAEVGVAERLHDFGPAAIRRWDAIVARRGGRLAAAGLAQANPHDGFIVLLPTRFGAKSFDAVDQEFLWPIIDEADETLLLRLPFSEVSAHAIERLEAMPTGDIVGIVGRLERSRHGRTVQPLATMTANPDRPVDCIFFDDAREQSAIASITTTLRDTLSSALSRSTAATADLRPVTATDSRLNALDAELLKAAERGTAALAGFASIDGALLRLRDSGLMLCERAIEGGQTYSPLLAAENLLRLRFQCQVARQLIAEA